MIFAVVPAAGKSKRMGRAKLALPLANSTVLEQVIQGLRVGGAERVVVVVSPDGAALASLAERAGAEVCLLPQETAHMRATVEAGLRWLEERHQPTAADCWLLCPADQPTLDAHVVRRLIDASSDATFSIWVPTYQGARGHPTLLRWAHVPIIRAFDSNKGLNCYLREQAGATLEVLVDSPTILDDLDTPEDYKRLWKAFPPQI